jgi:hypothetical protein
LAEYLEIVRNILDLMFIKMVTMVVSDHKSGHNAHSSSTFLAAPGSPGLA